MMSLERDIKYYMRRLLNMYTRAHTRAYSNVWRKSLITPLRNARAGRNCGDDKNKISGTYDAINICFGFLLPE